MKIPITITIVLLLIGIVTSIYILSNALLLNMHISNVIQIWICVAAFISATFVIYSYIHTNNAFISSQKPYLLLVTVKNSDTQTNIHYSNKSNNPFYDLTINAKVTTPTAAVNLSDLFYPKMYMAPHDTRNRIFNTKEELSKRGYDIDRAIQNGQEIILSLSYEFSFNKKLEKINVQEYIWEQKNKGWAIKYPILEIAS